MYRVIFLTGPPKVWLSPRSHENWPSGARGHTGILYLENLVDTSKKYHLACITAKIYQVRQIVLYLFWQKKFSGSVLLVLDFPAVCVKMPTWPSLSTTTTRPYMKPSICLYVLWQCLQHCPLHSHTHGLQPCPPSRVGMNVLTLFFVSVSVIYFSCNVSSQTFLLSCLMPNFHQ